MKLLDKLVEKKQLPEAIALADAVTAWSSLRDKQDACAASLCELVPRLTVCATSTVRLQAQIKKALSTEAALQNQLELSAIESEAAALEIVQNNLKSRFKVIEDAAACSLLTVRGCESRLAHAQAKALLTPSVLAAVHEANRLMVESNPDNRYVPIPAWLDSERQAAPAITTKPTTVASLPDFRTKFGFRGEGSTATPPA